MYRCLSTEGLLTLQAEEKNESSTHNLISFNPKYIPAAIIYTIFICLCIPSGMALNNTRNNQELLKKCDPLWNSLVSALVSPRSTLSASPPGTAPSRD
jgi:hypothetical protein